MKTNDIIRAWRDAEFLNSLSEEERAMLPANPAGDVELSDDDLADVNGGYVPSALCPPSTTCTILCPSSFVDCYISQVIKGPLC